MTLCKPRPAYHYTRERDGTFDVWAIRDPRGHFLAAIEFWDCVEGEGASSEAVARRLVDRLNRHDELVEALADLTEQTVEMDRKYGIPLTEGERDAYRGCRRVLAKARNSRGE